MSLKEAEACLDLSCESARTLYLLMLSIVGPLTEEASSRIEAARSKFNPTQEELNPNMKFVDNGIAPILAQDPDFAKMVSKRKLSWEQYDMFLRHLYERIRDRKYFKDYLAGPEGSLEEDARLWSRIFEREFSDNDELRDILEELSIYWNDDLGSVIPACKRTFAALGQGEVWRLPPLYRSDMDGCEGYDSDKQFVYTLLRTAYSCFDAFCEEISRLTPKWTRERICTTDLVLIVCGMAEAKSCPEIPVKVIINEYVEISKWYSTPESSGFVNGLLDKLINTQHQDKKC